MEKIKLKLKGVAEIVGSDDVALLTLTDELEMKQLSVVCDRTMARQLNMRLADTPVKGILLPEVLCGLMDDMNRQHYELLINGLVDGQYKAVLVNKQTLSLTPIRVSDGVLLALVAGLDIFILVSLMRRQSVDYQNGAQGISIPVNTLSMDMLEKALSNAISEENYELASQLRDEMKRRK